MAGLNPGWVNGTTRLGESAGESFHFSCVGMGEGGGWGWKKGWVGGHCEARH